MVMVTLLVGFLMLLFKKEKEEESSSIQEDGLILQCLAERVWVPKAIPIQEIVQSAQDKLDQGLTCDLDCMAREALRSLELMEAQEFLDNLDKHPEVLRPVEVLPPCDMTPKEWVGWMSQICYDQAQELLDNQGDTQEINNLVIAGHILVSHSHRELMAN